MGRKKTYDQTEVLLKGLMLFWARGYEAITMDELVKVTGLNRDSMYKVFGNKSAFYAKAMQAYIHQVFKEGPGRYFQSHQGLEAIYLYLESAIEVLDSKGCFALNTEINYQNHERSVQILVDDYKGRLEKELTKHLTIEFGKKNVSHLVMLVLAFSIGLITLRKRGCDKKELTQALSTLIEGIKKAGAS